MPSLSAAVQHHRQLENAGGRFGSGVASGRDQGDAASASRMRLKHLVPTNSCVSMSAVLILKFNVNTNTKRQQ